jgi:hypothetical protein
MADVISNILIGVNPTVKTGSFGVGNNTATYKCMSGANVLSPVTGKIKDINGDKVTIESNGRKEYTINGCNTNTSVNNGDDVSLGSPIGKTSGRQITLKSSQDLSSLSSISDKKENSNDNTESSGGLGLSDSEAQKIWDGTVGKAIGISNIPYNVVSKRIKRAIQKESIEIKDNVLSEELKRIKSLF